MILNFHIGKIIRSPRCRQFMAGLASELFAMPTHAGMRMYADAV